MGGLLQTDPQERAKTTTASSGCRPRPTAPDPAVCSSKLTKNFELSEIPLFFLQKQNCRRSFVRPFGQPRDSLLRNNRARVSVPMFSAPTLAAPVPRLLARENTIGALS